MPSPKYILTAQDDNNHDEDKDKTIASLQKAMDEKEHELKDAKAKLQADHVPDPHPPVVRDLKSKIIAVVKAMHEDDDEHKMHAMDEDHEEEKMAKAIKAISEIFDRGSGTAVGNPTNYETSPKTNATVQGEPSTKVTQAKTAALVAELQHEIAKPIITKLLTAKTLKGATEDAIKADETRLNKMSLKAVKDEYKAMEVFIDDALTANQENLDNKALTAKEESNFDFNGISLTASVNGTEFSIDKALGGMN